MDKGMHGSPRNGKGVSSGPDAELREPKKMRVNKSPGKKLQNVHMVKRFKGQGGKR